MISFSLIQIGPPNSVFIKSQDKKAWTAKDVADSVLSDKSALVMFNIYIYIYVYRNLESLSCCSENIYIHNGSCAQQTQNY